MTTIEGILRNFRRQKEKPDEVEPEPIRQVPVESVNRLDLDIAPHDPLLAFLQNSPGVVELDKLLIDSPAVQNLRKEGVKVIVPLVSQGELIGIINLGPRLSEQEYSSDDRKLLSDLAGQAAPAFRVAQLVREQQRQVAEQERLQQELRVARLIQQTLLPQAVPQVADWDVTAFYQPAQAVGGDFYDFVYFPDGKIGFIVADVTDKGVPAALVMATTRSILRAAAERLVSPGAVLERTNEVLQPEIPPKMFVTCFYALLDPLTGGICYANAGHDVPYRYTQEGIVELRATGMPLGLMPGMKYEEKETTLKPGEYVLLYSDGLVEAHNPDGDMFGFPRLQSLLETHENGASLKDFLLNQLASFTGFDWEQEDDITLVTLQHLPMIKEINLAKSGTSLTAFELPSIEGNERLAMNQVAEKVANLPLSEKQVERLKTAVAEATMNAMEHGNGYDPEKPVHIEVTSSDSDVRVFITDNGGGKPIKPIETPDLEAKLAGQQSARGWGLFLIQNMVDEMHIHYDNDNHIIELVMNVAEKSGD